MKQAWYNFITGLSQVKNLTVWFKLIHLCSISVFNSHWDPLMRNAGFHKCRNTLMVQKYISKFPEFPKENSSALEAGNMLLVYYIVCNESLGNVASGRVERRVFVVPVLNPTSGSLWGCVDTCCMPASPLFQGLLWTRWT